MDFLHLPYGENAPEELNVVVEIPQGSRNKYEYDKTLNCFRLDRALHSPVYYPGDYGFVPQTLAEDGDPLDVLILVIQPTFPGCLVVARPIGILIQTQVFPHTLRTISHFFETYKALEGKTTSTHGWQDAAAARRSIVDSIQRFKDVQEAKAALATH